MIELTHIHSDDETEEKLCQQMNLLSDALIELRHVVIEHRNELTFVKAFMTREPVDILQLNPKRN